ncbi:ABC transporter substrate-binding protein [Candidatus Protofrankia californiensis]|uniref:ABC transporter substrate-binding protein n=1 Tax=Candidatus Protofrankia californiensis TaxID=1839754 RepID=UPI001F49BFA7|nr:ABC transporter substrate-binding protein [Candidatus Protofrankia californiensis]
MFRQPSPAVPVRSRHIGGPGRRILPGMVVLCLGLAACSSNDGGGASPGGSGTARSGGTLTVAVASKPLCLDPQNNSSNGNTAISRQLVSSLTDQDPATGKIVPWLASKFEASASATEFTFTLRAGATFSDGEPVDAAAVKANFDTIVKLGAVDAVAASYLAGYQGTTVVDSHTAKVTFSRPNAQFPQATSTAALGLLSPASLARTPDDRCQGRGLAGAGPFVLKDTVQGQEIRLTRRTDYAWGSPVWKHQGAAYLDGIDYKVVPESGVRVGSLLSSQVDAVIGIDARDEQRLASGSATELSRPVPGVTYNLTANTQRPLLADASVRKALTKGIDRATIVRTLLTDRYHPATSILTSSTPSYANLSADLAYDPSGARVLLDAGGWQAGSDGIRTKDGKRLTLSLIYPGVDTASRNVLQLVQSQLNAIGVDAQLNGLPLNQLAPDQEAGRYDLLWFGLTRADPDVLSTVFSTTTKNRAHLPAGNPLDTLLAKQSETIDAAERTALVEQAQRQIVQQAYAIPVYEQTQSVAFTGRVLGVALDGSAQPAFFDAWLAN